MATWVKWWRSKTAWIIIITAAVAMVGSFLCAYYLAYPLNLIAVIAWCVPSGIIIRKVAIEAIIKKLKDKK